MLGHNQFMFIMDEGFIDAKFAVWAYSCGAPTMAHTLLPGESVPIDDPEVAKAASHDEQVFKEHFDGRSSEEAWTIFQAFQSTLKLKGLRQADEKEFRWNFLDEYSA